MVKDAQSHAEEDKVFKELVDLRNQADGMIHSSEKSLKDLANELSDDEKKGIETAISELKDAVKANEKAQIEAKLAVLTEASSKMAERVYAKKAAEGQSQEGQAQHEHAAEKKDEGVVDAEFEEVKEEKNRQVNSRLCGYNACKDGNSMFGVTRVTPFFNKNISSVSFQCNSGIIMNFLA